MRVVYVDTGLSSEIGHHATSCRRITAALRERGHCVSVAAWNGLDEPWRSEFQAQPIFRLNTYYRTDPDPICGWLLSHFAGTEMVAEDYAQLGRFTAGDLLYVNSVLPSQLAGLHTFLAGLPEAARPQAVVELGTDPGVEYRFEGDRVMLGPRDPRFDPRSTLYRLVGRQMMQRPVAQLHPCTFDPTSSAVYAVLLQQPVQTLPLPQGAAIAPRRRGGEGPRTVAIIGHQIVEKGYCLVPAIARALLAGSDVRLLVHNAEPARLPDVQQAMRALAAADARVELDERPAGPALWRSLLDRADLIVCPYVPDRFRAAYSAVASEAIACGIPLVVPEHTTLARLLRDFDSGGTMFEAHEPESVVEATLRALAAFDRHAELAERAAARWAESMGAGAMVDAMLALAGAAAMEQRTAERLAA